MWQSRPQSPNKRKRADADLETEDLLIRISTVKTLEQKSVVGCKSAHLFSSGDAAIVTSSGILLLNNVIHGLDPLPKLISADDFGITVSPSLCSFNRLEDGWNELMGCTTSGQLFSAMIDQYGKITTVLRDCSASLDESRGEAVSALFHAGEWQALSYILA
jgi:hypothetical protein